MLEHLKWKFVERPFLSVGSSYVDAFPFLALFVLLFLAGCLLKGKSAQKLRPFIQLVSFIFFIFVVHRCFCALRGWLFGLQEIGRSDLNVFNNLFIFVPLVAFTLIFGRVFCGWICPLGASQEVFFRVPFLRKFLVNFSPAARRVKLVFLALALSITIYLLIAFKPKTFFFAENTAAFFGILTLAMAAIFSLVPALEPRLKKMRYFFLALVIIIISIGIFITDPWCALFGNEIDYSSLISFFAVMAAGLSVSMAWCRYICPLGAFLSLVVKSSRLKIKRNMECALSPEAVKKICYTEALTERGLEASSCLYCRRCVDAGAAKIEEL